jgi:hypothetical protein
MTPVIRVFNRFNASNGDVVALMWRGERLRRRKRGGERDSERERERIREDEWMRLGRQTMMILSQLKERDSVAVGERERESMSRVCYAILS